MQILRSMIVGSVLVIGILCGATLLMAATTYTVTSREDSGPGSLREALTLVSDGDIIDFNVAGGNSITVYSSLFIDNIIQIDGGGSQVVGANGASVHIFVFNAGISNGSLIKDIAVIDGNSGIFLASSDNTSILGCRLGTDWSGSSTVGNATGIFISHSSGNVIGSPGVGQGNLISGNATYGLYIINSDNITILSNVIGPNSARTSALGTQAHGIYVYYGTNITIGGERLAGGNLISGNWNTGMHIGSTNPSSDIVIAGNIVGLNGAQTGTIPNGTGIWVGGAGTSGCAIGLNQNTKHNIISGNNTDGIYLTDAYNNTIQNNLIGLNESDVTYSNGNNGITINNSSGNLIGGLRHPDSYERNVISGHIGINDEGVEIFGASSAGNTISGNFIGTDSSGLLARANYSGIRIVNGLGNIIGGPSANSVAARGNIISGNSLYGLYLLNAPNNSIMGNTVGLTINEDAALPNVLGMFISGISTSNIIGNSETAYANVIAGNSNDGIRFFSGANYNVIRGNLFSVSRDGLTQLANGVDDVDLIDAHYCWIGGPTEADGNLFSGQGINLAGSTSNTVAANRIGVMGDLSVPSATYNKGILIDAGSSGNFIGLPNGGLGNLIANQNYNIDVTVSDADYNGFFGNTISAANSAPIGLTGGANEDKARPTISAAYPGLIQGTSEPNDYIEVFQAESSVGNGGSLNVQGYTTADGSGNWSLTPSGLSIGEYVCAMATDNLNNTSNFSNNSTVVIQPTATITPTITMTSTPTVTTTITPTSTVTETPTMSATVTPSSTMTPVFTATATPSMTSTTTGTSTITTTPTVTPISTATPTVTSTPELAAIDFKGKFALAYPNPGKSEIKFMMNLNESTLIELKIYSMIGEKISEISETLTGGQNQVITWNCQNITPGIYLVRILKDGDLEETKRIAIVR